MHSGQSFSFAHTNTNDLWIIDNENMTKSSTQFLEIWSNNHPWALGLTVDYEYRLIKGFVQRDVSALLEGCEKIVCDGPRFWIAKGKQVFHISPDKEPRLTTDPDFMKHKELWHERLVSTTHTFESSIIDLHTSNGKVLVVTADGCYLSDDLRTKISPSTHVRKFVAVSKTTLIQSETLEEYGSPIAKPSEPIADMSVYRDTVIFLTETNDLYVEEQKRSGKADKLFCTPRYLIASYQNTMRLILTTGFTRDYATVTIPNITQIENICRDKSNIYIVDNFGTLHIIPINHNGEILVGRLYESSFPNGEKIKIPARYGKSARK